MPDPSVLMVCRDEQLDRERFYCPKHGHLYTAWQMGHMHICPYCLADFLANQPTIATAPVIPEPEEESE